MTRAVAIRVDPDRLDEELARPDLMALFAKGYTVATSFQAEERGRTVLVFVLAPGRADDGWGWLVPSRGALGAAFGIQVLLVVAAVAAALGGVSWP